MSIKSKHDLITNSLGGTFNKAKQNIKANRALRNLDTLYKYADQAYFLKVATVGSRNIIAGVTWLF